MGEAAQSSDDYFPLDRLSVQMQLGMYEYVNGWTANELRKVDRLRRQIVDGSPKVFEKKRLIPSVEVQEWSGQSRSKLLFTDYCNFCLKRSSGLASSKMTFEFENGKCVKGYRGGTYCCSGGRSTRIFPATWSTLGSTLEECSKLITKGAKIEKLTFDGKVSEGFLQCIRHLIDSSLHIVLRTFESMEHLNNLVQEPRGLTMLECYSLDDEFFRNAGRGTLELAGRYASGSLTDERLAILVGRNDLTHFQANQIQNVTAEGVRNAVQILLQSSSPKFITLDKLLLPKPHPTLLSETLELDADAPATVRGERRSYSYGGGKVKVDLYFYVGGRDTKNFVHIVNHKLLNLD